MKIIFPPMLLAFYAIVTLVSCKKTDLPGINNQPPVALAGADQAITLPTDSVELSGSGIDIDGMIVNFNWAKVSGPVQYAILNRSAATTKVKNLTQGIYQFELTVTDNDGASSKDTVVVIVRADQHVDEFIFYALPWQFGGSEYWVTSGDLYWILAQGYSFAGLIGVYVQKDNFSDWKEVPSRSEAFAHWSSWFGFGVWGYYYEVTNKSVQVVMNEFDGSAFNPSLPISLKLRFRK